MIRWIRYRIARMKVRARKRGTIAHERRIMNLMSVEQKQVFDLVVNLAKKYPDEIRYDKDPEETTIIIPDVLITIYAGNKEKLVSIDNHTGFHTQWFYESVFVFLNHKVDIEAHRYRRRLKYEVKMRIREFLNHIIDKETSPELNELV
jgi:hypothetical protein